MLCGRRRLGLFDLVYLRLWVMFVIYIVRVIGPGLLCCRSHAISYDDMCPLSQKVTWVGVLEQDGRSSVGILDI